MDRIASGLIPDVVILDLVMPRMSGIECLKEMRAHGLTAPVVVLTATGGVDVVVQAMQAGAQDFFIKPASPERIIVSIRNALQMGQLTKEVTRLSKRAQGHVSFDDIVGNASPHPHAEGPGRARGEVADPHPDPRRKRGRQGADRAGHPRRQPSARASPSWR